MGNGNNEPVTIHITINDDGGFAYSVSTHRMTRKPEGVAAPKFRRVKWSAEGPFVIDFGDSSPFNLLTVKNREGYLESDEFDVEPSALLRRYRYAVAVFKNNEVFLDACPEVVVEC
jgi:hypothetical protein